MDCENVEWGENGSLRGRVSQLEHALGHICSYTGKQLCIRYRLFQCTPTKLQQQHHHDSVIDVVTRWGLLPLLDHSFSRSIGGVGTAVGYGRVHYTQIVFPDAQNSSNFKSNDQIVFECGW